MLHVWNVYTMLYSMWIFLHFTMQLMEYFSILRYITWNISSGAYRPIRNVRKRSHINFQFSNFLGRGPPNPPPFFIWHPSPDFFLQKRLHIKKPQGTPLFIIPYNVTFESFPSLLLIIITYTATRRTLPMIELKTILGSWNIGQGHMSSRLLIWAKIWGQNAGIAACQRGRLWSVADPLFLAGEEGVGDSHLRWLWQCKCRRRIIFCNSSHESLLECNGNLITIDLSWILCWRGELGGSF